MKKKKIPVTWNELLEIMQGMSKERLEDEIHIVDETMHNILDVQGMYIAKDTGELSIITTHNP